MEKKKVRNGVLVGLLTVLCIGVTFKITKNTKITHLSEETTVIQKGVKVRMLTTKDNEYGEKDEVFGYAFTPYNATNQGVEASLKYKDNTDCSQVMAYSIDEANCLITLSCKGPFSQQIYFTLTSKANPDAKATIVLDYVKKIKKLSMKQDDFAVVNNYDEWSNEFYQRIYDFNVSNFYDITFTEYTKESDDLSIHMKVKNMELVENTTFLSTDYTDSFTTYLGAKFLETTTANYANFEVDDIWNLATSNMDKSALKSLTKNEVNSDRGYLKYDLSVNLYSGNGAKSINGTISLTYFMYGNYLGEVGVDSLAPEVGSISF